MSRLTRREFVTRTAIAGVALQVGGSWSAPAQAQPATADIANSAPPDGAVALHWLEKATPPEFAGVTWGVPWRRGACKRDEPFAILDAAGNSVPVQTWPLAIWPDGSLKWSAHAIGAFAPATETYSLRRGTPVQPERSVVVREMEQTIEVDTGVIRCRIGRKGSAIIESIQRDGREIARGGQLVCLRQDRPSPEEGEVRLEKFTGEISKVAIEQSGPIRAVVRMEGKHARQGGREWLPFVVRLYFYSGADSVRMMHTFIFDGDEKRDFVRGLGVRFTVPMRDQLHDRHVRFVGEGKGLWAEGIRNLTGLRRDAGRAVTEKQLAGEACPPLSDFPEAIRSRLDLIPAWSDYTLSQLDADGFQVCKRTGGRDVCWINASHGKRAAGFGYIGGVTGGIAFGLRDFWQRHPTQLDIRGAATEAAEVTLWMWSPDAPPMDLRFYHDGMGMDTHPEQLEGLNVTYEDYEPEFGTPHGIARSSEITLWALAATPTRERLVEMADIVRMPPVLVCRPEHYHSANVFGGLWSLPDRSTPAKAKIEDQLDWLFDYYRKQQEQRHWYGFWNYGDVMHSYDRARHEWKYDIGGYAWDNSELSPDLWLWYAFLRSGRADIFRFAEAMTRHTGEVDVYHLGRFAMLGTRHGVLHWGDSAKQLRISTAIYRRFYYYLTGDERVGDLMRELVDADRTFLSLDPIRKIRKEPYNPDPRALGVGFGTDWGSLAAAWLTEWERTGDSKCREKLLAGMRSIGSMPHGFFTSGAFYDIETGAFAIPPGERAGVGVSHLGAVFGLPEVCAELLMLLDVPEFERAWLQYCELYSAPRQEQEKALGAALSGTSLTSAHSRLTAYAAKKKRDEKLALRAWQEFVSDDRRWAPERYSRKTQRIEGPVVLNPIDEAAWVSTNDASQWSLAAMQNLALVPEALEQSDFPKG